MFTSYFAYANFSSKVPRVYVKILLTAVRWAFEEEASLSACAMSGLVAIEAYIKLAIMA